MKRVPAGLLVIADHCYDTNAVRAAIIACGAAPVTPPKVIRRVKPPFSRVLYRARNAIERMFGRLKDLLRAAIRYDKFATNLLAAIYLAAVVSYWI